MAIEAGGIEVVTRGKRRYRTKLERRRIVEEVLVPGAKTAAVAKAHEVRASEVNHWKRLYKQGLLEVEVNSTALVPVRISASERTGASAPPAGPAIGRVSGGTIHLSVALIGSSVGSQARDGVRATSLGPRNLLRLRR